MSNFIDFLRAYTAVIRLHPFSNEADAWVNAMVDKIESGELTATLDNYTIDLSDGCSIWIGNFPYSFGYPHKLKGKSHVTFTKVRRKTVYRVRKLQREYLESTFKALSDKED